VSQSVEPSKSESMSEFKYGLLVRYLYNKDAEVPFGTLGTYQHSNGSRAYVIWDNGINSFADKNYLEIVSAHSPEQLPPDRTMIAAMAMQGMLSYQNWGGSKDVAAKAAVNFADQLIKALKETPAP
jgi:hypothetical protein